VQHAVLADPNAVVEHHTGAEHRACPDDGRATHHTLGTHRRARVDLGVVGDSGGRIDTRRHFILGHQDARRAVEVAAGIRGAKCGATAHVEARQRNQSAGARRRELRGEAARTDEREILRPGVLERGRAADLGLRVPFDLKSDLRGQILQLDPNRGHNQRARSTAIGDVRTTAVELLPRK